MNRLTSHHRTSFGSVKYFLAHSLLANLIAMASISALFMGQAQAELIVGNEPPPPVVIAVPTLTHLGAVQSAALLRRDIVDMEYTQALKAVAPARWKGYASESVGVLAAGKISILASSRPWTEVLVELLDAKSFVATVNWDTKEINVKQRP